LNHIRLFILKWSEYIIVFARPRRIDMRAQEMRNQTNTESECGMYSNCWYENALVMHLALHITDRHSTSPIPYLDEWYGGAIGSDPIRAAPTIDSKPSFKHFFDVKTVGEIPTV
jgi:hypothetical protein